MNCLAVRWDAVSGARGTTVDFGSSATARFHVLSPDGRYAVFEFSTKPGVPVNCWYHVVDLATRAQLFQVGGMNFDPDWSILAGSWVFSADGSTLVTCNQKGVLIREVPSGKELKRIFVKPIDPDGRASLSSDGKLLRVTSGSYVCPYNLVTGKLLDLVNAGESAFCTAVLISPDGRTMATQRSVINDEDRWVGPLFKLWRVPGQWVIKH